MKYIFSLLTGVLFFVDVPAQHKASAEPARDRHSDKNVAITVPSFASPGFLLRHQGPVTGFLDSKKIYSSTVKNHHLHGSWQSWYTGGQRLDSGTLRKGIPHGEWKHWDSAGNLLATRHYDATRLQRVTEEMKLHHPKRSFYPLTALYEKSRQAALHYLSATGSFPFHGIEKIGLQELAENNSVGKTYRPVFASCLHHGLYMNFYSNGQVKDSGYYKDGLPDGVWLHREVNGNSWQGAYKNGVKAHEWKQYNNNGQLLLIVFYNRRGEEEGRRIIKISR